jgi:preprotein translocase subunit SecF
MELIRPNTNYDFLGKKKYFVAVSLVAVTLSLLSFVVRGFRYGVDFAGGTVVQVRFQKPVGPEAIRKALAEVVPGSPVVQAFGGQNEYLIETEQSSEDLEGLSTRVRDALASAVGDDKVEIRRVEMVGPKVGRDLREKGALAVLISLGAILAYVWWRFELDFSVGGVIALFHDVIVSMGAVSLLHLEFDLTGLAAILTIAGFSINDTIVIFDRVRENMRKTGGKGNLEVIMNRSVNETLSRTLLTSGTVVLVAISLYLLGGPVIHNFAFIMLIGIIFGTYSSVYIASPIALRIHNWRQRRNAGKAVRATA